MTDGLDEADEMEKNSEMVPRKEEQEPDIETRIEEKTEEIKEEMPKPRMGVLEWLKVMNWRTNPFVFNISPSLFVGYKTQTERIMAALEEGHKYLLILGPTGSGKTTLMRWLQLRLANTLYIGKPPQRPEEFLTIFNNFYKKPWYAFWRKHIKSLYELPDFLNKKLKAQLVVLLDEGHEADMEILEWLRVLNDQVENMSVVVSGLPNFESDLRNNLETFSKRFSTKIELLSLTKEETKELIEKRIKHAGGLGNEFDHLMDSIYNYTGGFPREIIRLCDELVNNAIAKGKAQIEFDIHEKREKIEEAISFPILERMTPMQKEILELLSKKPLTPGQIANSLDLAKYKSRQHAVRSVNNIVKALQEEGYLERRKEEKAFVYSLSPRISTLFVKR